MDKAIIFIIGAGIGSLITWKIVEEKYKKIADEEIESVIERFKNREELKTLLIDEEEKKQIKEELENEEEIHDKEVYVDKVNDLGYMPEEPKKHVTKEVFMKTYDDEEVVEPYVIAPEEYGEIDSYETHSWTYYADGVLAEDYSIISDYETLIGDALSHFGEYEDDSVYVRNEDTECDYEILKHDKTFDEIYEGELNDTV